MGIAEDIIIILIAGIVAAFAAHRARLPLVAGYIIAGIIIGPYTGGITVTNVHQIELLAEIGVALLLFSIGLDVSFSEIREVRAIALYGTPLQLALTTAWGWLIGTLWGLSWREALVLGAIISLSSTMIVMKTLMARGLMGTLSSRVMIGILVVQDLAAVPMMVMIPKLGDPSGGLAVLGLTLVKGVALLVAMVVLGTRLMPLLLRQVARLESRELFLLAVAALGLGIGYLTHWAGLSFALGAFVAGMVLNQSEYSHKALNDIIPLRDLFGLIFFTSIGMLIDPAFVVANGATVAALVGLIVVGKFVIFALLARAFRYVNVIPLAVGLGLSQVGEFSFVLARLGLGAAVITRETYTVALSASVISMIISPLLSQLTGPLYALKRRRAKRDPVLTYNMPQAGLRDHVVIVGGGRVGSLVAEVLGSLALPYIVIEQDFRHFEDTRRAGHPAIFGDAFQEGILAAAHAERARLLLVTTPALVTAREIITTARGLRADLPVITRADTEAGERELRALGVADVVRPEIEGGLEMLRQSLRELAVPPLAVQRAVDGLRERGCSACVDGDPGHLSRLVDAARLLELEWIEVAAGSVAAGTTIGRAALRTATGATIAALYRDGALVASPGPDQRLEGGDIVAVMGDEASRAAAARILSPANRQNTREVQS